MPAIPYQKTATTDVAWDAGANEARLKAKDKPAYRQMFAWVDPSADEDTKGAYKFPHHMVSADGEVGAANLRACSAAIAALNGGRGGAKIPSGDREAVYAALAHHLKDAGKDAPELKSEERIDQEVELMLREGLGAAGVIEHRMFEAVEFRDASDPDNPESMRIDGHPAVFNDTADLGYFTERIMPGAFTRSIQEDDVRALINHDSNLIIGRKGAATLQLTEDERGLRSQIDVAPTSYGRDLMVSVKRRDITQGSIGFQARGQQVYKKDGNWMRDLTDVKLFDVSPVTFPAYTGTDYNARSLEAALKGFRNGPASNPRDDGEAWRQTFNRRRRMIEIAEL
jgi:uncharacterized protein